jgi:hypothetical protein
VTPSHIVGDSRGSGDNQGLAHGHGLEHGVDARGVLQARLQRNRDDRGSVVQLAEDDEAQAAAHGDVGRGVRGEATVGVGPQAAGHDDGRYAEGPDGGHQGLVVPPFSADGEHAPVGGFPARHPEAVVDLVVNEAHPLGGDPYLLA